MTSYGYFYCCLFKIWDTVLDVSQDYCRKSSTDPERLFLSAWLMDSHFLKLSAPICIPVLIGYV